MLVPVLRSASAREARVAALKLAEAGLRTVELTMSTPGVLATVSILAGEGLIVGVGTLTSSEAVVAATAAGARFVVSFASPNGFVRAARQAHAVAIPGALTPSEVLAARSAGAHAIKLFPAGRLGPSYVDDLHAVMADIRIMATGGIAADAGVITAWREAGAWSVGVGASLERLASADSAALRALVRTVSRPCS